MSFSYAVPPDQKGSFLAFLFAIRFIPEVAGYFKVNKAQAYEVMTAYDLTDEQKEAVEDLHPQWYPDLTEAQKASQWASLVTLLLPEFYDWTYNHQPPWWW